MLLNSVKKSIIYLISTIALFLLTFSSSMGFASYTHIYATSIGLNVLNNTDAKFKDFYDKAARDILLDACTKPDEDEIEGLYKGHFYNPVTELNFNGEEDSALRRFCNHYNNAVTLCVNGNKKKGIELLGRAIHYMEDLNTPVHTNNKSYLDAGVNFLSHVKFESKCDDVCTRHIVEIERNQLEYYKYTSLEEIGKNCAWSANNNFGMLRHKYLSPEEVAENSVLNAQHSVCGILYRFYEDIK